MTLNAAKKPTDTHTQCTQTQLQNFHQIHSDFTMATRGDLQPFCLAAVLPLNVTASAASTLHFHSSSKCKYDKDSRKPESLKSDVQRPHCSAWTMRSSRTFRGVQPLLAEHPNASSERGGRTWRGRMGGRALKVGILSSHLHPQPAVHQIDICRRIRRVSVFFGGSSALTGTGRRFVGPHCHTPPPIVLLIRGRTAHSGTSAKLRPVEAISIPSLRLARCDQAARGVVLLSKLIVGGE